MPQWLGIQQERTCVPVALNNQCYYIVMDWVHVLVIVQRRPMAVTSAANIVLLSGCLLGSWRQVASHSGNDVWSSLLLPPPPPLVHFGAISVHFLIWYLCFTIFIEPCLGFLSGDHAFTYSFNEVVSHRIVIGHSWSKVGCPHASSHLWPVSI